MEVDEGNMIGLEQQVNLLQQEQKSHEYSD